MLLILFFIVVPIVLIVLIFLSSLTIISLGKRKRLSMKGVMKNIF